jgi:hypothetical protein
MTLSTRAIQLLAQMFSPESNMQIPAGLADVAMELRSFAHARLAEEHAAAVAAQADAPAEKKSPFRRLK